MDLKVAREERAKQILKNNWMKEWLKEQRMRRDVREFKISAPVLRKEDSNGEAD
ncbi:hypothetical protein [Alicyclobacillus mengziensis]|uniref:Uncharacterized protein n=1 Tax=Alicyclobacillus mengziensis TaxID=2931921 RepID=A0A9X7W1C4_9BACL|nr:hypothetical protein [Alicyclobacillus mengziensis]QSO48372.1 hypothetical protein JZ786_05130 [Alicyclobacillus mengziensis]